jgi:hypothetical protein
MRRRRCGAVIEAVRGRVPVWHVAFTLETDLLDRRSRAEQEGWLGEIDGRDLTLHLLRQAR